MSEKYRYLEEVERYLALAPDKCVEVMNDLLVRIEDEESEGVELALILAKMGSPEALAQEMNETYFATTQVDYFEYKSNRDSDFPLVHIVLKNRSNRKNSSTAKAPVARGVFAFGHFSQGIVSVGLVSQGVISLGLVSAGLISVGGFSLGIFAAGLLALGGVSIGTLAVGVLTLGNILWGYATFGNVVGGRFALGNISSGKFGISMGNSPTMREVKNYLNQMVIQSQNNVIANSFFKGIRNMIEQPFVFVLIMMLFTFATLAIFYVYYINYNKIYSAKGGKRWRF
ncbi:hypothetical protein M2139_000387 [Enterococcus sp. PF1-24]|uniref:HAAS signaling domain-containing protein n=1 Tax=unclassified Enterococcus TaxID=2608891 RepID=UPI0024744C58|nr:MULTISPECIES: hypothetical protein [unclassified Enterococcus]MDH6363412.1 hypothetical protein [Enterococcus sp. PFB1-1]MDH6400506.1 hypothetical protein [Enterococcus sp. PF1-24]